MSTDEEELLVKVLVIGEHYCGKTSFVQRYVNSNYSMTYKITIGVDFALKEMVLADGRKMQVQFWDTAGQERFARVNTHYFRNAQGALVVFAPDVENSFERTLVWQRMVLEHSGAVPMLLVCNKSDLITGQPVQSNEELDGFCRKHGFIGWIRTSANTGDNISEAMQRLAQGMQLDVSEHSPNLMNDAVSLEKASIPTKTRVTPCCGR